MQKITVFKKVPIC